MERELEQILREMAPKWPQNGPREFESSQTKLMYGQHPPMRPHTSDQVLPKVGHSTPQEVPKRLQEAPSCNVTK